MGTYTHRKSVPEGDRTLAGRQGALLSVASQFSVAAVRITELIGVILIIEVLCWVFFQFPFHYRTNNPFSNVFGQIYLIQL